MPNVVTEHVKQKMFANFLDTFLDIEDPVVTRMQLFESTLWSIMRESVACIPVATMVYDTYSHRADRMQLAYINYGMSKRFVDACTWLWISFEGPDEYTKRNGHAPVDMWKFAYLAFNNEWDDLEPLLNMEI